LSPRIQINFLGPEHELRSGLRVVMNRTSYKITRSIILSIAAAIVTALVCIVLLHVALIASMPASIIIGILIFMVFRMRAAGDTEKV